ncbi:MAG: hypothetical protein U5L04_06310 [Trueperaceae bacterium]|nr:hypothetical protein [Trueperaceae bacterium]
MWHDGGVARALLFDLAVNRALRYLQRLGTLERSRDAAKLRADLGAWYTRTRFVYRIPLATVVAVLQSYPGPGYYWSGGAEGGWVCGENPRP